MLVEKSNATARGFAHLMFKGSETRLAIAECCATGNPAMGAGIGGDGLGSLPSSFITFNLSIERVPFNRVATGFGNQTTDCDITENFGGSCPCVVIDEFVTDCTVDIVSSIGERNLCRADSQHDPVCLDVGYVVEHQPADCHDAQVNKARSFRDVGEACVFRVKGKRNKRLQSSRFILQFA